MNNLGGGGGLERNNLNLVHESEHLRGDLTVGGTLTVGGVEIKASPGLLRNVPDSHVINKTQDDAFNGVTVAQLKQMDLDTFITTLLKIEAPIEQMPAYTQPALEAVYTPATVEAEVNTTIPAFSITYTADAGRVANAWTSGTYDQVDDTYTGSLKNGDGNVAPAHPSIDATAPVVDFVTSFAADDRMDVTMGTLPNLSTGAQTYTFTGGTGTHAAKEAIRQVQVPAAKVTFNAGQPCYGSRGSTFNLLAKDVQAQARTIDVFAWAYSSPHQPPTVPPGGTAATYPSDPFTASGVAQEHKVKVGTNTFDLSFTGTGSAKRILLLPKLNNSFPTVQLPGLSGEYADKSASPSFLITTQTYNNTEYQMYHNWSDAATSVTFRVKYA